MKIKRLLPLLLGGILLCLCCACDISPAASSSYPDILQLKEDHTLLAALQDMEHTTSPTGQNPEDCPHETTTYEANEQGHMRVCSACQTAMEEFQPHNAGNYNLTELVNLNDTPIRIYISQCETCDYVIEYLLSRHFYSKFFEEGT